MLEEAISRLRGSDRWPKTEATVVSTVVVSEGGYEQPPPSVRITFFYRDIEANIQSGELIADSLTSLYNLTADDKFTVQFNPRKPYVFYTAEATSAFTNFRLVFWLMVGGFTVVFLLISLLGRH